MLQIQKQRMIEAGFEHRRGTAAIFGRAQNHDDVGGLGFIDSGLEPDLARDRGDLEARAGQRRGRRFLQRQ